jgi:hypothetical protein
MTFQKLFPEDIALTSLILNPSVSFSSSSISGVTGSKYLFTQRSDAEKAAVAFSTSSLFNNDNTALRDVIQRAKSSSVSNQGFISQYLDIINSLPETSKNKQIVNILSYTPGYGFGTNYNKKAVVLNSLYSPFYKPEYPEAHYAYTNYNTLNFFSSSLFSTSSVLLYPNNVTLSGSYLVGSSYLPTGSFSFNFWIKPSYQFEKAGTIFHASGCYAISLLTGSRKDQNGNITGFKLLFQIETGATIRPSAATTASTFIFESDDNVLTKDYWHNVCIRWGTSLYNFGSGSIMVDNQNVGTFVIPSQSIQFPVSSGLDGPMVLALGNYYEGTNSGSSGISRFFGGDTATQDGLLELNSLTGFVTPATYSFTHPLNAEIHDFKIYNKYLTTTEIASLIEFGPSSSANLLFYVPPFFTMESPYRTSVGVSGGLMITPFFNRAGTSTAPFNADLAFEVGGHLINLENYTREFILGRYPRLLDLRPQIATSTTAPTTANALLYATESALKRNLTILPCDNGTFTPNFSYWLSPLSSSIFRNDITKDYSFISLRSVISSSYNSAVLYNSPSTSSLGFAIVGPDPSLSSSLRDAPGSVPSILQRTRNPSSNQVRIYDISNLFYGNRIEPGTVILTDSAVSGSDGKVGITLMDDGRGNLYRSNTATNVSTWNSVGNVFYNEGIIIIKNPHLYWFGESQFNLSFRGQSSIYTLTVDCYSDSLKETESSNNTWSSTLKASNLQNDSDKQYTYIGEVLLHDENLNVVARASLGQPVMKRTGDRILFKVPISY